MPSPKSQSRSLDEINTTYAGQWVMVNVTATHMGAPTEGAIVGHGPREVIDELLATLPRAEPGHPYYSFLAGPPIRTAEEWRAVLDAALDLENPLA